MPTPANDPSRPLCQLCHEPDVAQRSLTPTGDLGVDSAVSCSGRRARRSSEGHERAHRRHQTGVSQAVTFELVVAKLGDDLVPATCIPERGRGDSPTPRAGEKAGVRVTTGELDSSLNQVADRVDGGGTPTRPGHTFPALPPYAGSVRRFMSCMTQLVACTAMCFSAGAASLGRATDTVRMPLS